MSNASPNASVDIGGTVNNIPWTIPHWADTDGAGNLSASGIYAQSAVARYTLRVEIAGVSSNVLAVEVANCGWRTTGSLSTARQSHTATLLSNGKVLVVGGIGPGAFDTTATAELYDPTTGLWSVTGTMGTPRWWPIAVRLANGKVLVTGGYQGIYGSAVGSAEIYDPDNGTWRAAAGMGAPRVGHSATLLADGRVLVTGGSTSGYFGGGPRTAELYDPVTDSWSPAGTMNSPRDLATATLLPDGKVLVVGGINNVPLRTAEIYDPATAAWTPTGDLTTPRVIHTATLLHNGKVLVAGSAHAAYPYNHGDGVSSAEIYDPATGQWSPTSNMTTSRAALTATLLADGRVLAAGGFGGTDATAEIYDPDTGKWSLVGNMNAARYFHTATLLPSGQVLTVGGPTDLGSLRSADVYDPGLVMPLLTLNSTRFCVGEPWNLTVTYPTRDASMNLLGISNGVPWRLDRWGTINSNGSLAASGTFAAEAVGPHILRAEIQGVWSRDFAFEVSNCKP